MLKVERKWWSARGSASQLVRVNVQGGETRSLWSPFYRQTAMFHMPFCCCCYCWRWIVWPVARKIEQVVELVTWRVRQSGGVVVAACAPPTRMASQSQCQLLSEKKTGSGSEHCLNFRFNQISSTYATTLYTMIVFVRSRKELVFSRVFFWIFFCFLFLPPVASN